MNKDDIILVQVPARYMPRVWDDAEKACIGGKSNVRGSDREEKLFEDQLVALTGLLGYCLWSTDSDEEYRKVRDVANANPRKGDNGDIVGTRIDVKTSRMRNQKDPLRFCLPIRPRERHVGWSYVLALVTDLPGSKNESGTVLLMGWAPEAELPNITNPYGVFSGAYTIPVTDLRPMIKDDHPFGLPEYY